MKFLLNRLTPVFEGGGLFRKRTFLGGDLFEGGGLFKDLLYNCFLCSMFFRLLKKGFVPNISRYAFHMHDFFIFSHFYYFHIELLFISDTSIVFKLRPFKI